MPRYEYQCKQCGFRFERRQAVTEAPLEECPECGGPVRRLISGGAGLIVKGSERGRFRHGGEGCSLEQYGRTCCGHTERCGKPACENRES
jgi:putative FmdB family regulatory protein